MSGNIEKIFKAVLEKEPGCSPKIVPSTAGLVFGVRTVEAGPLFTPFEEADLWKLSPQEFADLVLADKYELARQNFVATWVANMHNFKPMDGMDPTRPLIETLPEEQRSYCMAKAKEFIAAFDEVE